MIKFPIAALVVFVALLGGFYGGYKVGGGGASAAAPASATGGGAAAFARGVATACPSPNATATPAASGRAVARRGTSGTVTNLTSSSLTVHDARCNTDVKVTFDPSVIIRKTATGQVSDLQESETVTVVSLTPTRVDMWSPGLMVRLPFAGAAGTSSYQAKYLA